MTQHRQPAGTGVEAIVVAIPARDEQERIAACLEAVRVAMDVLTRHRPTCSVAVVVAADDCHDNTAELAAGLGAHVVPLSAHCVGQARDAAIAQGLALLGRDPVRMWVANTDADTLVPPAWLCVQAKLAAHGCDVMAGTVQPNDERGHHTRAAWHAQHRLEEGHRYVHGANLGLRASAWQQLGGFGSLAVHEDASLVQRARDSNLTIVATDSIRATTSARRANRVPGGFAGYLATLPPDPRQPMSPVNPRSLAKDSTRPAAPSRPSGGAGSTG